MPRIIKILFFATLLFSMPLAGAAQSQSLGKPKKEQPKATHAPKTAPAPKPKSAPKPAPKPKPKVEVEETADGQRFTVNGVTFEMVRVEGGSFMMGSADDDPDAYKFEKPRYLERVSTFSIGRTEVTQGLWEAVMGSNPSCYKGYNLPVERVSWNDCKRFITELNRLTGQNFRLPTEAEWEFAARGGNCSKVYEYSGSNDVGSVAWYDGNSGDETYPVAQKTPNELGLYDMSGNVWEWTSDPWRSDYSRLRNSSNDSAYRVIRGGGFRSLPRLCRLAIRLNHFPGYSANYLGFRLALYFSSM